MINAKNNEMGLVLPTKKSREVLLKNSILIFSLTLLFVVLFSQIVYANNFNPTAPAPQPNALWDTVMNTIQFWVVRLGGVIMFVGGVMFGLGWRNDDAEQRSRGISTVVAGAIVLTVAGMTSFFFNPVDHQIPNPVIPSQTGQADLQSTTPDTPGTQPDTPGTQPDTPGTQPDTPGTQPDTPGTQPDTPGTQPDTPGTQPDTPGTQPDTPGTQPDTPGTQPDTPGTQPDTPGTQPDTPGTEPDPQP